MYHIWQQLNVSDLIRWGGCRCPSAWRTSSLWGPLETSRSLSPLIKHRSPPPPPPQAGTDSALLSPGWISQPLLHLQPERRSRTPQSGGFPAPPTCAPVTVGLLREVPLLGTQPACPGPQGSAPPVSTRLPITWGFPLAVHCPVRTLHTPLWPVSCVRTRAFRTPSVTLPPEFAAVHPFFTLSLCASRTPAVGEPTRGFWIKTRLEKRKEL